jgi:hypothetical protein
MTNDHIFRYLALVCMAGAIVAGAIAANGPADLPYLWEIKTATAALTGLAGLFLKPPTTAPAP